MSLKDQKKQPAKDVNNKALGEDELELNEEDLDTIAGGTISSQDMLEDDTNIAINCHCR